MLPVLLLLLVAQVPCAQNEPSVVCHCKQGQASACTALRVSDPKLADAIEKALLAVKLEEGTRQAQSAATAESDDQASSSTSEPPECTGQNHHVISRPIAKALKEHETLDGLYRPRDPRYMTQAKDEEAHCGYQDWHRKVDAEVIQWLKENSKATPKQFEEFLRKIYDRPEMRARFPNGF
ncbi:Wall-associated protein precursor [Hyalangium rubrum]|uniref:Wall-associated protein n=1 Tax=Hyalangium rubrum TaxID=3103134 RepID=A0ABU5H0K1_9BACT|nr:Wall-associated protein precursor [Hyalangium sp. s54d21]MDY7226288.1 Wall-associated protein precursor [Hyalangium sp. s54d21]